MPSATLLIPEPAVRTGAQIGYARVSIRVPTMTGAASGVAVLAASTFSPDGDANRREIWIIKRPAEHQSMLVVAGQHGVFLPFPNDPRSLDELARSLGASEVGPVSNSSTGDMFQWPSKPEYLLDPPPVTDHP